MRRLWYCALLCGIAVISRAELQLVGVIGTERATYFAVAGNGPARLVQLGERVEGWQLVSYDERGVLRLRKDEQRKTLVLPQGRVRDSDPLARAYTLAANGDKALAYTIGWLGEIAALKMEALRKLNTPGRNDISRLDTELRRLAGWEAKAKERAIVLALASDAEP